MRVQCSVRVIQARKQGHDHSGEGKPVQVSSYPWINEKTEHEIENVLADNLRQTSGSEGPEARSVKQRAKSWVNVVLRAFGLKIVRI
jgi:hypothetical protein